MARRTIRIRLSYERLEALNTICIGMIRDFEPENEHGHLLHEYLEELHHRLTGMLQRRQDSYTLCLAGTESIAFYQLWQMVDVRHDPYANIIVTSIVNRLSAIAA